MTRSTKVFLWVLVVLGLLILCGIVTGQPVPEKPKNYYHAEVTQGMGAAALLVKPAAERWVEVFWKSLKDSERYLCWMEGTNRHWMTNYTVIEARSSVDPIWRNVITTNGTNVILRNDKGWQWFRARGEWHW